MKVYLVEDIENAPGRVYAIFADREDAEMLADNLDAETEIVERTLFYGQPPVRGYNE